MEQKQIISEQNSNTENFSEVNTQLKFTLKTILKLNPFFIYEIFDNTEKRNSNDSSEKTPVYDNLIVSTNSSRIPYFTPGLLHLRHVIS